MSDPLLNTSEGTTPIDEDEALGLRLTWVRTRGDLNEAEAANILMARRSIRSPALDEVLDDLWLRRLHRRMFGDVWSWAGTYRLSNRNIGIDWPEITAAVRRTRPSWVSAPARFKSCCARSCSIHAFHLLRCSPICWGDMSRASRP